MPAFEWNKATQPRGEIRSAAFHNALRNRSGRRGSEGWRDVMKEIAQRLDRMTIGGKRG